jgi:outer membrane protein, heavy metal efflux system
VARARAGVARETQRQVDLEVAARIKTIFARYFAAFEGARLTRELGRGVQTLADVTQSRYAQGFAEQEDAIRSESRRPGSGASWCASRRRSGSWGRSSTP